MSDTRIAGATVRLLAIGLCSYIGGGMCRAQETRSGVISGVVTDSVTRLPVQGAMVVAAKDGKTAVITRTDVGGAYELHTSPGTLRVWAERNLYIKPGTRPEIEMPAGDSLHRDFELQPLPRISGAITDADTGAPMTGCMVFATRRIIALGESWYTAAGIPTAETRNGTFETVGLDPGDYILEITECDWSFYPGVSRIEMATTLTVTGAGIASLAIKLHRARHGLSGLTEQTGVDVLVVRRIQRETQVIAQTRSDESGRFEFRSVPEGEFHLITSAGADEVIEIADHDLAGVILKPSAGVTVGSSVQMLEETVEVPATAQMDLVPVFDRGSASRPRSTVIPGDYWPRLGGLTKGFALSGVLANNVPLPNGSFRIDGAASQSTFLVTSHTGTVQGTAAQGHSVVIAIREPFSEYLDQSGLPRTEANEKGEFTLKDLAPGRYRLIALSGDEELLGRNERFLRRKAETGEPVEITPDQIVQTTLR